MSPPPDIDRAELAAWRRALAALPRATREVVLSTARLLLEAAAMPPPRRRPVLLAAVVDDHDDEAPDEVAQALARRILTRHSRSSGGAA